MKSKMIGICFLQIVSFMVAAQTWHVSGTGNDTNDGKSESTAFRSLQKAAVLVQPGEVVLIGNGVYSDSGKGDGSAVLNITKSGKPGAWITWKARPGHKPEVRPLGWCGIQVTGSYHIIDGLAVTGNNDAITLLNALDDAKKPRPNPSYNTNGICVEGRRSKPNEKPHHVTVRNCVVSKCAGGGIVGLEMDYLTIEDGVFFIPSTQENRLSGTIIFRLLTINFSPVHKS